VQGTLRSCEVEFGVELFMSELTLISSQMRVNSTHLPFANLKYLFLASKPALQIRLT
jgi:hypothetical protein